MPELKKYKYHELANDWDLMEGDEFDAFVADIKENGLNRPITLFEGKILDGRNRYRACQKLGIPGKYENLPIGRSAEEFVWSENFYRRHLNTAQRASQALKLLAKEERKAKQRQGMRTDLMEKGDINPNLDLGKQSSDIVGVKYDIGRVTLQKAKKIEKIAKTDKLLSKQWNKAKKGKTSVDAVYQIAQIIEIIEPLSTPYKHKIRAELEAEDKSIKQIKSEIQDKKDDLKRNEIVSRDRALVKKQEEMEKLYLKIHKLKNTIYELEGEYKQSKAMLKIFSNDTVEKYPNIKSNDSDRVVQYLGMYYDTLDIKVFIKQLKDLKAKYDKLEKPLRDKLAKLESERKIKKDSIDKQKQDTSQESGWIEKQLEIMLAEYDKQEVIEESIAKDKKVLKELQEKYDDK